MVMMDPQALGTGAGAFASHADELGGHLTTVASLESLRDALQGAGMAVWPAVEARLAELRGQITAARERAAHAGTVLKGAADGGVAVDQNNATNLRR
jgi:hypothetical protein